MIFSCPYDPRLQRTPCVTVSNVRLRSILYSIRVHRNETGVNYLGHQVSSERQMPPRTSRSLSSLYDLSRGFFLILPLFSQRPVLCARIPSPTIQLPPSWTTMCVGHLLRFRSSKLYPHIIIRHTSSSDRQPLHMSQAYGQLLCFAAWSF